MVVFAQCRNGCKVRLILADVNGTVPVRYRNSDGSNYPADTFEPAKRAIPYLAWCVAHKEPLHGKPIRVKHSEQVCDDRCTHATGEFCKCSCGGLNHGSEAY